MCKIGLKIILNGEQYCASTTCPKKKTYERGIALSRNRYSWGKMGEIWRPAEDAFS